MLCRPRTRLLAACAGTLLLAAPAGAVISKPIHLNELLREQLIFVAQVEQVLPERPAVILTVADKLKGDPTFDRLPINLTGDSEAAKGKHTEALLERVEKGLPVMLFVTRKGNRYVGFGCTNGTWFSLEGRVEKDGGKDVVRWAFHHVEPYFHRTFSGTTAELRQAITDGLKGKDLPGPSDNVKPGFGPPLPKRKGFLDPSPAPGATSGGLYAVIQLPFLGAIAALAALFPAVFGGLALMMKRWVAALSTASLLSLLFFLQVAVPGWVERTWMRTPQGFWITCAAVAAAGGLWAARRYRRSLQHGKGDDMQTRKLDRVILVGLSALGLATVVLLRGKGESLWASPWLELLVAWGPVAAASYYAMTTYLRVRAHPLPRPASAVSAEMVMLWALAFTCGFAGAFEAGRFGRADAAFVQNDAGSVHGGAPQLTPKPLWAFEPPGRGTLMASPCLTPHGIVVATTLEETLSTRQGRVHCVDPQTGTERWYFDEDGDMACAFSSPVYADGRVYVGEGLHEKSNCRLFCLDAATGKKLWDFKTESHTESTPCVADGRVVFGAGNDGIYCLDAKTGEQRWHHTGASGLHVDANPAVVGGRVYAGSGLSRTHRVNRIFCLDLATGNEVWGERVEHSAYGSPAVYDGVVYFGLGNGTYGEDRDPKLGVLLARDAKTGASVWDRVLPNSILGRPAVDRLFVYVGTRDGNVYALDRQTGEQAWKQTLGAPVLAAPTLAVCPGCGQSEALYVAGEQGRVAALSPATGNVFWSLDLASVAQKGHVMLTATPLLIPERDGTTVRRRVLVGAGVGATSAAPMARLFCFEDTTTH